MIDVKIFRKPKDGSSKSASGGFITVTELTDEARHAAKADVAAFAEEAEWANRAGYASRSAYADLAGDISSSSPLNDRFLHRLVPDTAKELITFEKGLHSGGDAEFGAFEKDASGAGIWMDEQKNWHIEGDYLHARKKLVAKEVQIEDVHHVGGQQLLTAASMTADFVVEKENVYRCFFRRVDEDGKEVYNKWRINDQAYVCTFNLKVQDNHTGGDGDKVGNHYLWRLVTATSNETSDTATYDVGGEMVDASEYHFIDLSKTICDSMSDAPIAGDDIVQLGHQGNDLDRQNAIILAGAGTASPYIREFTHITTFHLPAPETQLKPGDNLLSGIVKMTAGSQLPDGSDVSNTIGGLVSGQEALREDVDTLDTGNENLLRNTGFTGDYESDEVQETTEVDGDTEMWSPRLKYWEGSNVEPVTDVRSTTGMAATLTQGILKQSVSSIEYGEPMCISLKCFGTAIAISFGGYSEAITPTDNPRRYIIKTNVYDASKTDFVIQGTGTVMEVMLTRGKIPNADWIPSPLDNDKAVSYFQNLSYLANAITNADTNILGGLILTQMIRVGNYRDGGMNGETGGMSGIYTSEQSPFLWGGGDMEQAFYTIGKYARDPSYQATEEEVRRMAKFVVTHGGRAILNDIVLRGYIYALGGYFRGEVHALNGSFKSKANGNSINIEGGDAILTISGPARSLEEQDYPPDPTAPIVDFLKAEVFTDPDGLTRGALLSLLSHVSFRKRKIGLDADNGIRLTGYDTDDETEISRIKISNDDDVTIYRKDTVTGIGYTTTLGSSGISWEAHYPDGYTMLQGTIVAWSFRNNGQLSLTFARQQDPTITGILDVDSNGYLKINPIS